MPTNHAYPTVIFALSGVFCALPAFVSCGSGSAGGGGAGGSPSGGAPAAGGTSSLDSGIAGTPFMSLGGSEGGACKKTGESCTLTGDCCAGNLCNRYGPAPEWIGCQIACTDDTQCASGCCYHFQGNNGGFCTDAKWCACGGTKAACSSTLPPCCSTHVCLAADAQSTSYECRQKCTQNSDCDTACCVPITQLGVSACLDKTYCP